MHLHSLHLIIAAINKACSLENKGRKTCICHLGDWHARMFILPILCNAAGRLLNRSSAIWDSHRLINEQGASKQRQGGRCNSIYSCGVHVFEGTLKKGESRGKATKIICGLEKMLGLGSSICLAYEKEDRGVLMTVHGPWGSMNKAHHFHSLVCGWLKKWCAITMFQSSCRHRPHAFAIQKPGLLSSCYSGRG